MADRVKVLITEINGEDLEFDQEYELDASKIRFETNSPVSLDETVIELNSKINQAISIVPSEKIIHFSNENNIPCFHNFSRIPNEMVFTASVSTEGNEPGTFKSGLVKPGTGTIQQNLVKLKEADYTRIDSVGRITIQLDTPNTGFVVLRS